MDLEKFEESLQDHHMSLVEEELLLPVVINRIKRLKEIYDEKKIKYKKQEERDEMVDLFLNALKENEIGYNSIKKKS